MNTLALIALMLVAQISDWIPRQVVSINEWIPQTSSVSVDSWIPDDGLPPDDRRNGRQWVWVYSDCPECNDTLLAEMPSLSLDFAFGWREPPEEFKGGPMPVLHWNGLDGKGRTWKGWSVGDARDFREYALSTLEPSEEIQRSGKCYPIRSGWWTVGPVAPERASKALLVQHLQQGEHRGKFDPTWLGSLSIAELHSLHADDHERRIKWDAVQRLQAAVVVKPKPVARRSYYCPTCPR